MRNITGGGRRQCVSGAGTQATGGIERIERKGRSSEELPQSPTTANGAGAREQEREPKQGGRRAAAMGGDDGSQEECGGAVTGARAKQNGRGNSGIDGKQGSAPSSRKARTRVSGADHKERRAMLETGRRGNEGGRQTKAARVMEALDRGNGGVERPASTGRGPGGDQEERRWRWKRGGAGPVAESGGNGGAE
ncbi:hypothetical protein B0H14DRAFT_3776090 [Mycena olivaceomarginata]|nr:hypothetical protein B0H14DRAFT_3776090 [Mycena olivaceomarginata]